LDTDRYGHEFRASDEGPASRRRYENE
jgi:hypothetical protein